MTKDVITRFKLETTQYDSKIKNAAKELSDVAKSAKSAGADFERFTKDNLEAARSLGTIATSSVNAKDRAKELVGAFNDVARSYNQLTEEQKNSDFGKAVSDSLTHLQQRIRDTKEEMKGLEAGGGGLFGGGKLDGMLQVFGGNLMTKGVELATSAVTSLISETGDMIKQGVELAKQGEGIRVAFERLGRGDLLQGLREATHGTVTDLELMKAAVQFNDFKLPLDQLGTMLAFAQQKAKDTGQSVDYLVQSIVTGLGRKSLMILDNLGLSATEIRERMKQTGDMTKAVGAIIRDQMAAAGDYVETAADRAAQANVSLQNKMEELGRKFAPIEEASNQLWTSMKIGILDIIGGPLTQLLNGLTEAGRMRNALNNMGGNEQVNTQLGKLRVAKAAGSGYMTRSLYSEQVEQYNRQINTADTYLKQYDSNHSAVNTVLMAASKQFGQKFDSISDLKAFKDAYVSMKNEYVKGAQEIMNATSSTKGGTTTTGGKGGKNIAEEKDDFVEISGLINMAQERVSDLQRRIREAPDETTITILRDQLKDAQTELDRLNGKEVKIQMETGTSIQNDAGMSAYISSIKKQLETADYGTSLYNGLSAQLADMTTLQNLVGESLKAGLGTAMFDAADATGKDFWTRAMEGGVEDTDWQAIIDKINEKLKEMDIDPINIDFKTGKEEGKKSNGGPMDDTKKVVSGLNQVASGLQQMGIQLPEGVNQVLGVVNGLMTILQGINTIIGVTQFAAITANTISLDMLTAAVWANTASSFIPFAGGGIVHAANGWVGGNSFSGDRVPAMLNSGELVLNRAQQGVLANALEGSNALQNLQLNAVIRGEQIRLVLNNNGRRTGRGEYVQTNRR